MWPWGVIEVGKNKKIYFFTQSWFCSLFGVKVYFLIEPARNCCCCGQFDIVVTICVGDLQHLLISLARSLKYFKDVELLYPSDKFQTNWIFYREHTIQNNPFYCVADTIKVMVLFYVSLLNIQFVWNSLDAFAVILPQQRPVLVSAHARNFFRWSSAKKTSQGNANYSAPKTVIGMTKIKNERYLPYLQLCVKA